MRLLAEKNEDLRNTSRKQSDQMKHWRKILEINGRIQLLLSFKLADMVNIALDEGNYFKTKEWCNKNAAKMMVEH